ncbi:FadR/GntR family transcriptional regulator [Kineococcus rubinsiae]|uniref:FadR/GntR family transcriptional regulator n=1 Tax=Kineococcus rubinsiae TaxID=2609562 RepID=UPI0027E3B9DC|nr:FCD domain-containing protein [Kineococcus rubinsiae]NIZ93326.1 FadR family transcriptional regulator [Kineococcus rubinsiae]
MPAPGDARDGAQAAVFRPVRAGNAFEETVERLLQAVRLGIVATGERLPPERELAARLGVSRVTLREAIRSLAEAGLVESRRGRSGGTFVVTDRGPAGAPAAAPDPADLRDALRLRRVLEVGAVELAAERTLSEAVRADLAHRLELATATTLTEHRAADSRLHLALAEAAGSPSLVTAVADVRMRVNASLDRIPFLPPNLANSHAQHREVVAAVLAGDPGRARTAMHEHLDATAALLRGFLG